MLCEDKNDKLDVCDNTLIHENSMLLLKSPIYTIEEKYAHVEKYLYGLHLSYAYGKSSCNNDVMIKGGTNNYFERGKHDYESLNKFNDHHYMPQFSKIHDSNSYTINFPSSKCNYYERGGYKHPLYANDSYKLHLPTINMHWYTPIVCDSFIYKIPMHRKKLRLRYYLLHILCCVLMCYKVLNIFIGMITPWNPGILLSYIISHDEKRILKNHHSYNMIVPIKSSK
jgi:hypothetical protein